jgi:uncharacterized membrane protein
MITLLRWAVAVLLIALVTHVAAVFAIPGHIMSRAMQELTDIAGGVNTIMHAPRADHEARAVVRPSPDLFYSLCVFDLSQGPLAISARVPRETYWSMALYGTNSANFLSINDRQVPLETADGRVSILLAGSKDTTPAPTGMVRYTAPGNRGLVLFRSFAGADRRADDIDAVRQEATCAPHEAG